MGIKGRDILMIDDSEESLLLAKRIAENSGVHFHGAQTIDDGLKQTQEHPISLILLDILLDKGENGLQFLHLRLKNPSLRRIPVIVFSVITNKEVLKKAMILGANDFLEKPIRAATFLQKLRKNLSLIEHGEVTIPLNEKIDISIRVPAELIKINETSCVIRSPARLPEGETVTIESNFLESLGLPRSQAYPLPLQGRYATIGEYDSTVTLVGVNERVLPAIRRMPGDQVQ